MDLTTGKGSVMTNTTASSNNSHSFTPNQVAFFEKVSSPYRKNIVLQAYAGCGKTSTIQAAYKFIIEKFPEAKVFYLAFNKNIKQELIDRGLPAANFHGYGLSILAKNFPKLFNKNNGLAIQPERGKKIAISVLGGNPVLLDENTHELMREAANLQKIVSLAKGMYVNFRNPEVYREKIQWIINRFDLQSPGNAYYGTDGNPSSSGFSDEELIEKAAECMKAAALFDPGGGFDYDDLVWWPIVNNKVFGWVDFLFCDEAQDLNAIQVEFARRMLKQKRIGPKNFIPIGRIILVGDENQAIYEWRGAMSNAMEWYVEKFKADVLPLDESFRCGKAIIAEAQQYVPNIKAFHTNGEGEVLSVGMDAFWNEVTPSDFVVSRTRAPLFSAALKLLSRGVRARVKGQDVADGLVSMIENSECESVAQFRAWLESWHGNKIAEIQAKKHLDDSQKEKRIRTVVDTAQALEVLCEGLRTTEQVIARIQLLCENKDNNNPFVELMTTHGAKGLETDRVWMFENTYRAQFGGEELRLAYVAVTRAKKTLFKVCYE